MKVHVENSLYIESDGMQFIVKDYTGKVYTDKKTGKETEAFNTLGYFSTLEQCVQLLIKQKVMQSTATDLKSLLEDVRRLREEVEANDLV